MDIALVRKAQQWVNRLANQRHQALIIIPFDDSFGVEVDLRILGIAQLGIRRSIRFFHGSSEDADAQFGPTIIAQKVVEAESSLKEVASSVDEDENQGKQQKDGGDPRIHGSHASVFKCNFFNCSAFCRYCAAVKRLILQFPEFFSAYQPSPAWQKQTTQTLS